MTRIEIITERISRLEKEIEAKRNERNALAQEKAELLCPFKPGDLIRHLGRRHSENWFVLQVDAGLFRRDGYRAQVAKQKKDGTQSKIVRWFLDDWELKDYDLVKRKEEADAD